MRSDSASREYERIRGLTDEDLITDSIRARGPSQSRLENYRREIPEVVGKLAQVVVDNPGPMVLVTAGSMVAAKMALNLVKPRTMGEAIALCIVLQVALPKLAWAAVEKGWITFRVRDEDGNLIPLMIT